MCIQFTNKVGMILQSHNLPPIRKLSQTLSETIYGQKIISMHNNTLSEITVRAENIFRNATSVSLRQHILLTL
jgi:hypothetical protein